MSIVKSIRNLGKDPEQLLLEKHGLVDDTGAVTKEGARLSHFYVLKHYRDEIIADLKAHEATIAKAEKKA